MSPSYCADQEVEPTDCHALRQAGQIEHHGLERSGGDQNSVVLLDELLGLACVDHFRELGQPAQLRETQLALGHAHAHSDSNRASGGMVR
jgi:hypothetical protein